MNAQELLKLKERVDEAKQTVAELKGQQTALLKQLKDEWKCSSIEAADRKIKEMKEEIEAMEESIETGLEELEERYGKIN